jgi:Glycosyl transferase family 2
VSSPQRSRGATEPIGASIIIVNKADPGVANTLASLRATVALKQAEVIVVDASGGELHAIRDAFPEVRWIDFDGHGRSRTIAEQRNVGVGAAAGRVLVFLDANCVPGVDWFDRLTDSIADGSESIVAGRIAAAGAASIHESSSSQGGAEPTYLEECATMNVAIDRQVVHGVGSFDQSLGLAEDADFAWRCRDAGFRIRFEPSAVVAHDWGGTDEELSRAFRYGVGRVRLYRKHPDRLPLLVGRDRWVLVYGLFLLLLPLALLAPEYLLVLAYPLARNRRHRPVFTVLYHLVYAAGALAELLHLPVLRARRRSIA